MGGNFTKNMSVDDILDIMDKSSGNTEIIHAGPCFLQYQLHKQIVAEQKRVNAESMREQQKFQNGYLWRTTWLVVGTWALVLVTFF